MKKIKNKEFNNIINILIKILFVIGTPCLLVAFMSDSKVKEFIIVFILSLICSIFICFKFLKNIKFQKKKYIISLLLALYSMKLYTQFYNELLPGIIGFLQNRVNNSFLTLCIGKLNVVIFTAAAFGLAIFIYFFIEKILPHIINFYKKLEKHEKNYLLIIIIIGIITAFFVTNVTTAFSMPKNEVWYDVYDVIYTADNGSIVLDDAYYKINHPENDIRQPLFGIAAFPFALIAKLTSNIIIICPSGYEYAVCMTIIQFILLAICTIMVSKMLKLNKKESILFFILTSTCFSYLLFSIVLEQYVIALFYLILTVYVYFEKNNKINYLYIPAVGTLLTTGIILPLITKSKGIINKIKDIFKVFVYFLITMIISGRILLLLNMFTRTNNLITSFGKADGFSFKCRQFTYFIQNIFVSTRGRLAEMSGHPAYQLAIPEKISIIGIIIFIVCIIGAILNRKNKFVIFSSLWMLFSILLLFIIGWGAPENGMILYSLYFAFAYISLLYMFLRKIIKNNKAFTIVIYGLCSIILIINSIELINILKFAITYY